MLIPIEQIIKNCLFIIKKIKEYKTLLESEKILHFSLFLGAALKTIEPFLIKVKLGTLVKVLRVVLWSFEKLLNSFLAVLDIDSNIVWRFFLLFLPWDPNLFSFLPSFLSSFLADLPPVLRCHLRHRWSWRFHRWFCPRPALAHDIYSSWSSLVQHWSGTGLKF